jgi:hypothetical protein
MSWSYQTLQYAEPGNPALTAAVYIRGPSGYEAFHVASRLARFSDAYGRIRERQVVALMRAAARHMAGGDFTTWWLDLPSATVSRFRLTDPVVIDIPPHDDGFELAERLLRHG